VEHHPAGAPGGTRPTCRLWILSVRCVGRTTTAQGLAKALATSQSRVYLTGRIRIETSVGSLEQERLPGRQGRVALARLVLARSQPLPRETLAATLWPDDPPAAEDAGLSAIVSKLRSALTGIGLKGALRSAAGCYELRLPPGTWVDVEAAATELDLAEGALRQDDIERAWGSATVANAILRRPFLPGNEGGWVESQCLRLRGQRLRASDCLAETWLRRGEGALAQHVAEEAIGVAPLREGNYRLLMRAHLAQGNRSDALLAFHRCRHALAEELGVDPSPETQAVFADVLGGGSAPES
jgi:SARP family transcriptional regulator, regulator of embCAB operon